MKILFKKLKRAKRPLLITFIIILLTYTISLGFFIKNIVSLSGIETLIRYSLIILFIILLFIYLISGLVNLIRRKHGLLVITSILMLVLSFIFSVSSYFIDYLYGQVTNVTEKETVTYTTYLIALKGTEITKDSTFGMINDKKSIEWNKLAKKLIKKEKYKNEIKDYEDNFDMLGDLYNRDVDAIFVSSNYLTLYSSEETYQNIQSETYVVKEYSEEMENQDLGLASTKALTEPFTVLLMGVDSKTDGLNPNAAFNGDTLMFITFNPKTLNATVFSVPRDTYVPIACRNNKYAKINSSAAYGTTCVIDTIEQFTGVDVDYYAKINFKGVVELVEALGGIDVNVTKEFCEQNSDRSFAKNDLICLKEGYQHLNGEQTLAYARHRKTLPRSDIDRTKNQQLIVEAMAKKVLSVKSFNDFKDIMEAVSKNISTNMSDKQILSMYNILKKMIKDGSDDEFIKVEKTYLEYYSLPVYTSRMYTSAIGHYPDSLKAIVKAMKVNLELEKEEPVKTMSYSVNTPYENKLIGQGITTGTKLETLPDFTGQSVANVRSWASTNGISINVEGNESGNVITQSYHAGVLVKSINSLKVTAA